MIIRYYGHVGLPTGYGDAANEMCMAILSAGHQLEIQTDAKQCPVKYLPLASCFKNVADMSPPDAVIVHTLPLDCAKVLWEQRIRELYPNATCVAYTTWEGCSPVSSAVCDALSRFDDVWVPSSHTAATFAATMGDIVVEVVPHAYDAADEARYAPMHRDPNDRFTFYYIGAWSARKNVEGLIRAYVRAFDVDDPVRLVIHSAGAAVSACHIAVLSTGVEPGQHPPIEFSHERVTDEIITLMHRKYQCFVTAARGEAWNLPAFHAMLARRHIITPRDGSSEFLEGTSAAFIPAAVVPGGGEVQLVTSPNTPPGYGAARYLGHQGFSVRDDWLDPDLRVLAQRMRGAVEYQIDKLAVHYDTASRFGREAVGSLITELLDAHR